MTSAQPGSAVELDGGLQPCFSISFDEETGLVELRRQLGVERRFEHEVAFDCDDVGLAVMFRGMALRDEPEVRRAAHVQVSWSVVAFHGTAGSAAIHCQPSRPSKRKVLGHQRVLVTFSMCDETSRARRDFAWRAQR